MALTSRRDRWMAMVSACLLGVYLALVFYGLFSPSTDPQRGMAQGFLTLMAVILLSLGATLWFGAARNHPLLVRLVFAITILPGLSPIARLIYVMTH